MLSDGLHHIEVRVGKFRIFSVFRKGSLVTSFVVGVVALSGQLILDMV